VSGPIRLSKSFYMPSTISNLLFWFLISVGKDNSIFVGLKPVLLRDFTMYITSTTDKTRRAVKSGDWGEENLRGIEGGTPSGFTFRNQLSCRKQTGKPHSMTFTNERSLRMTRPAEEGPLLDQVPLLRYRPSHSVKVMLTAQRPKFDSNVRRQKFMGHALHRN
jgi:hypothetical protein